MPLIKKAGTTKGINLDAAGRANDANGTETARKDATRSIATPAMAPGVMLQDRYLIEGVLGVGGMSVVYLGRDMRFKDVVRQCAIKEMSQSAPDSHTRLLNLKNFEREAGLLATLHHHAIPRVYDFFEENGRIYLILELIPGKDLETVLDENKGGLPENRVVNWAIQICDVLTYLHNHQPDPIVFRDMKPSNVMVAENERVMLIDFGIARDLVRGDRKGTMIGTEGYSPPEQYRGLAEPRGDVYALGATMHHLLTNSDPRLETPFTFQERPLRQLNPLVSPELDAIISRALEYDVTARWASAEELKQALLTTPTARSLASAIAPALRSPVSASVSPAASVGPAAVAPSLSMGTEVLWRFRAEDEIRSSPCVANGLVFVGSYDTNIYGLDAARGEMRWKFATEGGIASSPAVWQDMVVVGSEDGAVYALDQRRGTSRWTFRTSKAVRSSPRVEERVVFVGSDDQHFYALDGLRGTMIWKFRTWMPIRSSACIGGEVVFVGGDDGHIYCLDIRTGGVRWKQKMQQPVRSTPAYSDGIVFVGSMDNNFYALDAEGGWPIWRVRTGHYVNSSPCVSGSRVFVGGVDGIVYAFEAKNGRAAWKFQTNGQITSSPRVEQGRLYIGGTDGILYCLDSGSGSLIWKFQTEGPIVGSPAVQDGIVYVGSLDQQLYALKA